MNFRKLFLLSAFLLVNAVIWCQDVTTNLGNSGEGWPTPNAQHPASSVQNTIEGCNGEDVQISLTILTVGEHFEVPSDNILYRLGGGNDPSSAGLITVVITFSTPVLNPILCLWDIDSNGPEQIVGMIPPPSGVTGDLTYNPVTNVVGSVAENSNGCIQWTGLINQIILTYRRPTGGGATWGIGLETLGFDCPEVPDEPDCCEEAEPVNINSDFEDFNTGFQSDYEYTPNVNLLPGQYGIYNGDNIAQVCSNWNVQDPVSCDGAGNFMVVNGRANQYSNISPGPAIIWRTEFENLNQDFEYLFCAKFKDLNTCCFNVPPTIIVHVGSQTETIDVQTSGDPCDWMDVSIPVSPDDIANGTLEVYVELDQGAMGDGNDLAIDEIKLGAITSQVPISAVIFTPIPEVSPVEGFINISATAPELPSEDCTFSWTVCQFDDLTNECMPGTVVSNPIEWQSLTTAFEGYNGTEQLSGTDPGLFDVALKYEITYEVSCPCLLPRSWQVTVQEGRPSFAIPNQPGITGRTSIGPNPSNGKVNLNIDIENTALAKTLQYFLTDLNGKVIKEVIIPLEVGSSNISEELDFSSYPAGMYLLQGMIEGEIIFTEKLIKE